MRKRKDMPVWQETLFIIAIVFFLAILVRTFLGQAYYIPSGSMQNTLQVGDRVLVNKAVYDFRAPKRGEVVVFKGTSKWAPENFPDSGASLFSRMGSGLGDLVGISRPSQQDFIKRVIGLPGDYVACCDSAGRVTVNGIGIDEPYVTMNAPIAETSSSTATCSNRNFRPVTVQPGMMFVMGDDRQLSLDSRCEGQVPISNVIGKASAVMWPSSRWTDLSIPAGFKKVPEPQAMGPDQPIPIDGGGVGGALVFPLLSAFGLTARSEARRRGRRRRLRA